VAERATVTLKLPMRGGRQSLNAAVAAGIMMYELCRDLPG
jgi:tRNA G18 (ribose-2'-O)-methylase SpoU